MSGNGAMEIPCLGKPFQLGMLYDCRNENLISRSNVWEPEVLSNALLSRSLPQSRCGIYKNDSMEDKMVLLGVDDNFKLSLMSGLVDVAGSAKFLDDRKSSKQMVRVTLKYERSLTLEELDIDLLANVPHESAVGETNATHFVSGVLSGTDAFFVFDRDVDRNEDYLDVERDVKMLVNSFPDVGSAGVPPIDSEEARRLKCTYYGDVALSRSPINFEQAVESLQELKQLEDKRSAIVPKRVRLHPLSMLSIQAPRFIYEVDPQEVTEVQRVLEELHDLDLRIYDLFQTKVCSSFTVIQKQLSKFQEMMSQHRKTLINNVASWLPQVRGGAAGKENLSRMLADMTSSPFHQSYLSSWVSGKEKEFKLLSLYLNFFKGIEFAISPEELDAVVNSLEYDQVVCFSFMVGASQNHQMEQMQTFLRTGKCNQVLPDKIQWYEDQDLIKDIKTKARSFRSFATSKENDKCTKFIVTIGSKRSNKQIATIQLYKDGNSTEFNPSLQSEGNGSIDQERAKPPLAAKRVQENTPLPLPTGNSSGQWMPMGFGEPNTVLTVDGSVETESRAGGFGSATSQARNPRPSWIPQVVENMNAKAGGAVRDACETSWAPASSAAYNPTDHTVSQSVSFEDGDGRSSSVYQLREKWESRHVDTREVIGNSSPSRTTTPYESYRQIERHHPDSKEVNEERDRQIWNRQDNEQMIAISSGRGTANDGYKTSWDTASLSSHYEGECRVHTQQNWQQRPVNAREVTNGSTSSAMTASCAINRQIERCPPASTEINEEEESLRVSKLQANEEMTAMSGLGGAFSDKSRGSRATTTNAACYLEEHPMSLEGTKERSFEDHHLKEAVVTLSAGEAPVGGTSDSSVRAASDAYHLAERVRLESTLIEIKAKEGEEESPPLYKLPMKQTLYLKKQMIAKQCLGEPDPLRHGCKEKVLMVMGATGAGKSTLINGMVNYIMGVKWEDGFRFKLITEEGKTSQASSQTKEITAYTIHPMEGSAIPYTFTIIDTPGFGDTEGLTRDKFITNQVKEFFSLNPPKGVDHLDGIGFVTPSSSARLTPTQKYIFDSILSIFGKDVGKIIFLMVTFADGNRPPVLEAVKKANISYESAFKFNNSAFFADNTESEGSFNELFWKLGSKSFLDFFSKFGKADGVSLQLTNEVLKERDQLEALVEGLNPQIKHGLAKIEEMRVEKNVLQQHEADIATSKGFEYKVPVMKMKKTDLTGKGIYTTTCLRCNMTCHKDCAYTDDKDKDKCCAMERTGDKAGFCKVCPKSCKWNEHKNYPYLLESETIYETRTLKDLKDKYDKAMSDKTTAESMVSVLEKALYKVQIKVVSMMYEVRLSLRRLDEIALKPNPLNEVQYIELLIETEKREGRSGWMDRVKCYEKAKEKAQLFSKIKSVEDIPALVEEFLPASNGAPSTQQSRSKKKGKDSSGCVLQ